MSSWCLNCHQIQCYPRCVGIVSVHARSWIRINELRHVLCIYDCQCAFWFVPLHICPSPLRSSDPEDPLPGRMLLYKATKPGFSFLCFFCVILFSCLLMHVCSHHGMFGFLSQVIGWEEFFRYDHFLSGGT